MQHGDDVDDAQNLTPRPGSGLRPVHRPAQTDPTPPSFVKVLLCIGVVGLTFIGLMSFIVVVGVSTLWTMVEEHSEAEARKQAAEVAKYSHFVPFKPGDPLPEPPLDLLPPAIPSARLGKYDLTEMRWPSTGFIRSASIRLPCSASINRSSRSALATITWPVSMPARVT